MVDRCTAIDRVKTPIETGQNATIKTDLTRLARTGGIQSQPRFNFLHRARFLGMKESKEEQLLKLVEAGKLRIDSDGRIWRGNRRAEMWRRDGSLIFSMVEGQWVRTMARRLVWRYFNGPIPKGARLGARDGNIWNHHPDNIEILRSSERRIKAFWAKVNKKSETECWEWSGSRSRHGYGQLYILYKNGNITKPILAHRFSWELHFGSLEPGQCALHKCDNPPCVNPSHLFKGTMADNMADCVRKGRNRNGATGPL